MKKTLSFLVAASVFGLLAMHTNAMASVSVANTNPGDPVTVTPTNVSGAANLVFNPSTNVIIDGDSDETSFAIWGYHSQVLGKSSGQAYGMAADTNKLFFLDISGLSAAPTVTGTNAAAAFTAWTTI